MFEKSLKMVALMLGAAVFGAGCGAEAPGDEQAGDEQVSESQDAIQVTCGGITGRGCEGNAVCVDDPNDNCDPRTDSDCGGVCIGSACGGFVGGSCPTNYVCVDDPRDSCDPAKGGADCPGTCLYGGEEM